MHVFRQILAFLLFFFAALAAPPAGFLFAVSQTFLDEQHVTEVVIPQSYDVTIDFLAEDIFLKEKFYGVEEAKQQEIVQGVKDVFSKEIYVELLTDVIHALAGLSVEVTSEEVIVSLEPLRTVLLAAPEKIVKMIPECEGEKQLVVNDGLPTCIPQNVPREEFLQNIERSWKFTIDERIPLRLAGPLKPDESGILVLLLKENLLNKNMFTIAAFFLPLLLIALGALLLWKPIYRALFQSGITIAVSGLLWISFGIVLSNAFFIAEHDVSAASEAFVSFMLGMPAAVLLAYGIGILIAGAAFIAGSIVLRTRVHKTPA